MKLCRIFDTLKSQPEARKALTLPRQEVLATRDKIVSEIGDCLDAVEAARTEGSRDKEVSAWGWCIHEQWKLSDLRVGAGALRPRLGREVDTSPEVHQQFMILIRDAQMVHEK